MATRMQKYYENDEQYGSRTQKNQELYKEIAQSEIDKFELSSNATVLSDAKKNIDIEKIKKILDTKYKEAPKRRSIKIEQEDEKPDSKSNLETTKEYDINAILEKAKENKEQSYDEERLKKIRDTQFDILNHLNVGKTDEEKEETSKDESNNDLMNLINTITAKEMENRQKEELDPLDILTDLKGDGEVTSPIEKNFDNTIEDDTDKYFKKLEQTKKVLEKTEKNDVVVDSVDNIDNSFFTSTTKFTNSDFDDFNDLKAEVSSHKTIITVLVVVLMIIVVVAIVLGLNKVLDLGLF